MTTSAPPLSILTYPYRRLRIVAGDRQRHRGILRRPGSALIWDFASSVRKEDHEFVRNRPGGAALILILPPAERLKPSGKILGLIEAVHPNGILPHHEVPHVDDLAQVLRWPPSDLGADITEYLAWRGIRVSRETRRLVRRTVELSADLRSITALSRGLYMSRRALGRRFEAEGLPVPSHWLHFSRLLRVTLRLQNSEDTVTAAGFRFGYSDGFSLSNQMHRLTGFRPSDARTYLGWEWLLEAWLRREAERGGLRPEEPPLPALNEDIPSPPSLGRPGIRPKTPRTDGSAMG